MKVDKLSHWLQGAALVVAIVGLWFLSRRGSGGAATLEGRPDLPTSPAIQLGGVVIPGLDPGNIIIGGNPIYTTYNYPPATPNPVGATATNDGGQAQAPFAPAPPAPSKGGCGGCKDGCNDSQLTNSGLSGLIQVLQPGYADNLFSLDSKGTYQYN